MGEVGDVDEADCCGEGVEYMKRRERSEFSAKTKPEMVESGRRLA